MDGLMLSALLWAGVAAWCFVACVAIVFCTAAQDGDRIAREALQARRQEARAREDTRPHAVVISFPQGAATPIHKRGSVVVPSSSSGRPAPASREKGS